MVSKEALKWYDSQTYTAQDPLMLKKILFLPNHVPHKIIYE